MYLGRNGAGKSTAIKLILGLCRAEEGTVTVLGSDSKELSEKVKQDIGVSLAESGFSGELTVNDVKHILKKMYHSFDENYFIKQSENLKLPMNKKIKELSGGMRQRLGIAQAILNDPKILILDEPTAGLDPQGAQEMMTLFMNLNKKEGKTVLLVTHDMEHVMNYCDHVIVLSHGEVTQEADVKEFFKHPEYLQEIGINPPSIVRLKMQLEENGFEMNPDIMDMNSLVDSIEKQVKKHE